MLILAHWYLANNPYPRNHWRKYTSSSLFQDVSKASTTPRSVTGTEWSQTPTKLLEKKEKTISPTIRRNFDMLHTAWVRHCYAALVLFRAAFEGTDESVASFCLKKRGRTRSPLIWVCLKMWGCPKMFLYQIFGHPILRTTFWGSKCSTPCAVQNESVHGPGRDQWFYS